MRGSYSSYNYTEPHFIVFYTSCSVDELYTGIASFEVLEFNDRSEAIGAAKAIAKILSNCTYVWAAEMKDYAETDDEKLICLWEAWLDDEQEPVLVS